MGCTPASAGIAGLPSVHLCDVEQATRRGWAGASLGLQPLRPCVPSPPTTVRPPSSFSIGQRALGPAPLSQMSARRCFCLSRFPGIFQALSSTRPCLLAREGVPSPRQIPPWPVPPGRPTHRTPKRREEAGGRGGVLGRALSREFTSGRGRGTESRSLRGSVC